MKEVVAVGLHGKVNDAVVQSAFDHQNEEFLKITIVVPDDDPDDNAKLLMLKGLIRSTLREGDERWT